MHTIKSRLDVIVSEAMSQASGMAAEEINAQVIYATRPEFGDYQANGVMAIAKRLGKKPRDLAQEVVDAIPGNDLIAKLEIAGPGFINITLADEWLNKQASEYRIAPSNLIARLDSPQTIVVDYSSPNLAKEMHVGHLRGTIIGDAIVRIQSALGNNVIRQNHVGDWGTQFGMLIAHLESLGNQEASRSLADLEVFYREAKQRFDSEPEFAETARSYVVKLQQGDPACLEAWQRFIDESLGHCQAVYDQLGVALTQDDIRAESFYNSDLPVIIEDLRKEKLLTEDDGANCVFLDEFKGKDGSPLPVIVQKRDGGYLYATTDLAAIRFRGKELKADRILYVVDARQSLHFQQVFAVAHKAGFVSDNCELTHIAYGTMMGEDGKPFKTRSGDTVKLRDLLDESVRRAFDLVTEKNPDLAEEERHKIAKTVGIAAVKYSDLSKNRTSDYIFDWRTMLSFDGNTAPYLLYAFARIQSVIRRLAQEGVEPGNDITVTADAERRLVLKISQFSEVLQQMGKDCYPNQLCQYLYELSGTFMKFYESCPILKAEPAQQASRLGVAALTAEVLKQGLNLLGIEPLHKM
ncbi:arginine--tRNA ligase [Pseudohongiella nitratireducens]|uniref:Arginine--tRNA ligase n=1 Tax=Pseudohongiella nitratireducens TaxID=1768907 RepID=A0A916QM01_9GAMM|nr:arginine--tRNA ligase [Pseudohongiella nitratireducens]GFZ82397.1 arginine--tRNA ligase [Pseudohongiella nitratireducens]